MGSKLAEIGASRGGARWHGNLVDLHREEVMHSQMAETSRDHDTRFMEHALNLARKAIGMASPNPLVGCVIVNDGEIVGQGCHEYDGRAHAEVLAIKGAGEKARGATLYVTLEPCNHTGRTGPCTEALIAAGIAGVVAAMEDPNPKTRGSGLTRLRGAR